jgi:hypothetical protein
MDTGVVGIVDLATKKSSKMKMKHANVSACPVSIAFAFIDPTRLDGLSNLSLTDLVKFSAVDTTVPSSTLISCKVVYFRD